VDIILEFLQNAGTTYPTTQPRIPVTQPRIPVTEPRIPVTEP